MKKVIISACILLSCMITYSQDSVDSLFADLNRLEGKVKTYYSLGSDQRAKYMQTLIEDAVSFLENISGDTTDFVLLVLQKKDWKIYGGTSYPLSSYEDEPNRVIVPAKGFFSIKLKDSATLYGSNKLYLSDLIAFHELGHHLTQINHAKGIPWAGEMFSNYVHVGFMHERIPEVDVPEYPGRIFTCLPFRYKTLDQFDANYHGIGPFNYVMYQVKFAILADLIYQKAGWTYMQDFYLLYQRFRELEPDKEQAVQMLTDHIMAIDPSIDDWLNSMGPSGLPYVIMSLLILLSSALIIFVRRIKHKRSRFQNRRILMVLLRILKTITLTLLVIYGILFFTALMF